MINKAIITIIFLTAIKLNLLSQTANSIANGNWLMPTTWDCMCIPTNTYNVNISHTVTMTSDWAHTAGTITVNSNGTLEQDLTNRQFAVNGANFINNGNVLFYKIAMLSGTFSNTGDFEATDSLYLAVNLNNNGTVTSVNIYNSAQLTNNSSINAVNFFNNNYFENVTNSNFTDYFNNGTCVNNGTITFNNSTNAGVFTNNEFFYGTHDFTNAGTLYNTLWASIFIDNNCTNGDSLNNNAQWMNNGLTYIANDFTNTDTLSGSAPGQFCVVNNSANLGYVSGDFDFCDQISGGFGINMGTIENSVTICQTSCFGSSPDLAQGSLKIFPNPASCEINVEIPENLKSGKVELIGIGGSAVLYINEFDFSGKTLNLSGKTPGVYTLRITTVNNVYCSKLILL